MKVKWTSIVTSASLLALNYIMIVVTSEEASDEHPFSIRSASDGTSWKPRGKKRNILIVSGAKKKPEKLARA